MHEKTSLTFSTSIVSSPESVYLAMTNGALLQQWLCNNAQVSSSEGGRIFLHWSQGYYMCGEFTKLDPHKTVNFQWQGRNEPFITQVHIDLEQNDSETAVSLTHSDIPAGDKWATTRQEYTTGWENGLANLKSILETGLDKRIYDQPFLGILIGGVLSAEQAEEQNLPIKGGILINGTMDGTGAQAIGLQNGDVLVNLGGSETSDFPTLQAAIRPFKAGETTKITYYRDGEKQSDQMTLSRRPAPQLPEDPAEAADALRTRYDALIAELNSAIEAVDENAASYRPSDEEWNAKEVLSHLIYTERFNQATIIAQIANYNLRGYPSNPAAWIESMLTAYPSLSDMVTAWKNSMAETAALIEKLPDSYTAQKSYYLNTIGNIVNFLPGHAQGHIQQIKTTLATHLETA